MTCFVTFFLFFSGTDAEDSYHKFYDWLYNVYDDAGLPCGSKIKGKRTRAMVQGCFHHLMGAEALNLVGILQAKLAEWGAACISNHMSCGSVLISANNGRGQSSLEQQLVGPFLD